MFVYEVLSFLTCDTTPMNLFSSNILTMESCVTRALIVKAMMGMFGMGREILRTQEGGKPSMAHYQLLLGPGAPSGKE